ncbi:MAG: ferrous iron transport protein B [Bacteroidales bacterium]|nr:ferrous iron transport protein B [Bacteroidales bacterium]
MNCDLNCAICPFAASEIFESKGFVVNVAGAILDRGFLDFSSSPVLTVIHRGYHIRFINFSGEQGHIGRKILASNPDLVLNVVDSTHLSDGLNLASRLIDMDSRTVMVLGRYDKLLASDHSIDYKKLSHLLGVPVLPLGVADEESRSRFFSALVDAYEAPLNLKRHVHVSYGSDLDAAIAEISAEISESQELSSAYHDRYLAVRLLEDPEYIYGAIKDDPAFPRIARVAALKSDALSRSYGESVTSLVRKARLGFVHGAIQETLIHSRDNSAHSLALKIDSVLTSRLWGFPILLAVLFLVFQLTFKVGSYPQAWIENGIASLSGHLYEALGAGWLSSLLCTGIVQGVGAVLAFLPNIVILFFFLSLLEDSGYMARAAFLMDKIMHKVGLHGRSFVPMVMGFGCNVPAIMAARSIEDRKDRTLTMLMIPYMSCSARLPVYLLLVSAFFAQRKALVMISIYLLGILLSILFAFVMKRTEFFRKSDEDYVSELPPFRRPAWRNTGKHIWDRVADYLKKISTVILAASVIIWALEYFPVEKTQGGAVKEESCLAAIGQALEPVTAPLGFDWKMNVCLLTGLPAKEAIVSTMGILYHTDSEGSLMDALRSDSGFTPNVALAFMAFVLLYFPCIATIGALKREAGWKWAAFSVIHSLLLAWVVAFLIRLPGLL